MPRSKRAKVVHLSKVTKKGKEHSQKTFANVQEAVEKYPYLYVFSVDNMRNTHLKDVRTQLASDSRLFFGKTKVMAKALGETAADAPQSGTHLLNPYMRGTVGLLASEQKPAEIRGFFDNFRPLDYARAGTVATRDFTIPGGVINSRAGEVPAEEDLPLAHNMEPNLRQLGVPTRLVKGKVELDNDFVVCKRGETLGSGQTTLLKMFGVATAEFVVELLAYWDKTQGQVTQLQEIGGVKVGNIGGMDVDDNSDGDGDDDDGGEIDDEE